VLSNSTFSLKVKVILKIVRVQNWRQAQDIADKMILWGFRGQEDSSWELDTTLHRIARVFKYPVENLWHSEYWMLRQFQRRAHHYCKDLPGFEQKLDWLALMQHYGAPTRLLDFSHSFYVAAYFALENASKDSAVWAVNLEGLRDKIAQHCEVNNNNENIDMTNQRHINFVNKHISDDNENKLSSQLIVHVEPDRLHERLLIQQGVFLFPCDIAKSFQENIASTYNTSLDAMKKVSEFEYDDQNKEVLDITNQQLIKIILPKEIRDEAMGHLFKMNITAATLFPGLDGFARSMNYHITRWPGKLFFKDS
jgi:hypothetical protein